MNIKWLRFAGWSIIGGMSAMVIQALGDGFDLKAAINWLLEAETEMVKVFVFGSIFGAIFYGLIRKSDSAYLGEVSP